ncbi:MAG: peptidoglycan-binding protein, partial [Alicyclobacillus sp.]|nr:peptidoglycan-binding protein [Alicyclobacillus sp.]
EGMSTVTRGSVMGSTSPVEVTTRAPASSRRVRAGVKVGDQIVQVNGKSILGMPTNQATELILGPSGTTVHLGVKRPSAGHHMLHFAIKRAKVTAPTVYSKMLSHDIGYIQITVVGEHTGAEFNRAWHSLLKRGATRVVLDLRGNPGGYLDQAVAIGNTLIPKGKVIVQTVGRNNVPHEVTRSAGPGTKIPIVVLMDGNTASAAEILSAALHDDDGAPLVGTHSYGKGTVQVTDMYPDGSGLKYTVARWLTPTGTWIEKKGVQPTVRVALPAYANLPPLSAAELPLRYNQNSADVATLQKVLRALGWKVDRVDGYFDVSTREAVAAFQRSARLPVTGVVGEATAEALQNRLDAKLASHDTQLQKAEQIARRFR